MRIPDPLILGAGPAGCAAAIALAKGGARPLLIDRAEVARDPLCGGFISWRTAEQLARLGVDCAELGAHRVIRLRLVVTDRSAEAPLPAPAWGLSRHAMDSALRTAALAAGARFEVDTIRSVEGLVAHGSRRDWSGETLFLASGKHDVRGLARPRMARDPALGLRLRLPPSPAVFRQLEGTIELHLFDGGYAGIVLQEGGSANICLAVKKSLLTRHGGDPALMLTALGKDHPAFGERLGGYWRDCPIDTVGAVPYGWIAQDTAPGLFRLGDQAAVIPSLAGEGMGIALASGVMAAQHFLAGGRAAAIDYQRQFAARAQSPLRLARLARAVAERPVFHAPMLALLGRIPAIAAILMDATRIPVAPSPCASAPRC
ncbi:FAD-dependent monooxygenase [Altererythrobacter sp. KTW20L]|uniref:NAD(P)/FAD-dependent oxidoreductase n=1 Tax=Altererythrobacter sp. KTW20L TaxID=2942210 RepID=UPI0020C153D3|nr:FAD-dependent monooxygenase [Altererythrobacter sp. KTW20L]MCL6251786.1 FAD-dependent monooxygenase [Altererythrobacter sp. KTW20L]